MRREKIDISQVHPNEGQIEGLPANPRLIKDGRFRKLVKSIQDLPEMTEARDLLVYPYDGNYVVIGGNMRLRAYQEIGWKEVPCCVLPENMPVSKLREIVIQDNNPFGETDWNMIANEWDVEKLKDWGVDLPVDWDTSEAEEQKEAEEDDFSDEDAEKAEPRVKLGEIWQLGDHRLMCGDSTDAASVALLMGGQKADMVFTDPPYQLETKGGCKGEIGKALKKQGADIEFISDFNPENFLKTLLCVFKKNTINAYIFCNKNLLPNYLNFALKNNISYNVLVWKKPNAIPIADSHRPDIEYLVLYRKKAIWNNSLPNVNYSRCLDYGRETGLHPTMKPTSLIGNELKISSNEHSIIFDFFDGSGSTLIACEQLNRKCYMMELDPHYCDVIIARWEKLTGKEAVKVYG